MPEHWKNITGFEGFYQVSSLGRVRSKSRYYFLGKGYRVKRFHIGEVVRLHDGPDGEKRVRMYCNAKSHEANVYELYVEAFCKIDFGPDEVEEPELVTVFELND